MGTIEKVILDKLKKAVAERFPLCKIILFGSRARRVADPQSDLDVLVILETDVDMQVEDYVSDCAWEAGFEYGIVVAPITVSRKEWEEGPERNSLLALAVKAEGVTV